MMAGEGFEAGETIETELNSLRGGGNPLPDSTRNKMESGFGADFSSVRVHTGARSDQLNRSINAQAFTQGTDVFFGAGKYNPHSSGGQRLLAHELTHVVQQTSTIRRYAKRDGNKNNESINSPLQTAMPGVIRTKTLRRKPAGTLQRKLMVGGEAKDKTVAGDTRLKKGESMALEGLVDDQTKTYKFATLENLLAYLKDVRRDDLVEIEEIQAVEESPALKKSGINWSKGIRAVVGGILGTAIGSPILAVLGGVGGAIRGAAGGFKNVWEKIGRGNKNGGLKFLAGLAAIGGGIFGMLRGAITGALGGAMAGPAAGALLAAPELADEKENSTKDEPKIMVPAMKPGDIVLVRGGGGVSGGMIQFGQYLHQLWSGSSRGGSAGFRHAGVYVGGGMYAHSSGGVFQDGVTPGLFVYRNSNEALAKRAAKVAEQWADFRNGMKKQQARVGYSGGKAADAIFRGSGYSNQRAAVLAAYFERNIDPGSMFCSEFAISAYQAAALQPGLKAMENEAPDEDKGKIKDWAHDNAEGMKGHDSHGLMVDPRTTAPQMLAAELHRQSQGDNPTWKYIGVTE
jgi:hypothetical protein